MSNQTIQPVVLSGSVILDLASTMVPEETGRRVTGVLIGWGAKDIEGRKAAYAELQRPRVGRKARITGTVEEMLPPEVIE